jgi:hypothetical protein
MHVSGHADVDTRYYRRHNPLKAIALANGLHKNLPGTKGIGFAQDAHGTHIEYLHTQVWIQVLT